MAALLSLHRILEAPMKWFWISLGIVIGIALIAIHRSVVEKWFPEGELMSLESLDHLSQFLLFCVAVIALLYARAQISVVRASDRQSLEVARATFLLQLESRWAGNELLETRNLVHRTRESILKIIAANNPNIDDDTRMTKLQTRFAEDLLELRQGDESQKRLYTQLMRFCSFFEFVGYMVKNEDIRFETVVDMFLGPITLIDSCFRKHITALQNETGVPPGLYEHALFLADEVKHLRLDR